MLVVPHFNHVRIGEVHDIGDAERAAYFDKFATGDDRLTVAGEFVEYHHHSSSIVVDRNCCLCSPVRVQISSSQWGMPAAALHGGKVVFQSGVALCGVFDCRYRLRCEGASSQIGMEYHACGIDYLLE